MSQVDRTEATLAQELFHPVATNPLGLLDRGRLLRGSWRRLCSIQSRSVEQRRGAPGDRALQPRLGKAGEAWGVVLRAGLFPPAATVVHVEQDQFPQQGPLFGRGGIIQIVLDLGRRT